MTTLQDKTNTTGVSSPGNQIQFSRGGIAKKKYRRKSQRTDTNNENATSNGDSEPVAVDWWKESKEMMLDWFRCNPLRLGISGDSVKFVQDQIKAGDEKKSIRAKCWRHIVVEMSGVPGLDKELLSLDHIPAEASGESLANVLGLDYATVQKLTDEELKATNVEAMKRLLVEANVQKTKLKQRVKVLTKDMEMLKQKLKAASEKKMTVDSSEESVIAPAGSGIAAVKALQRPSSQPSGEDINKQEQVPQRPLTDRSDVSSSTRPYNNSTATENKSKNGVEVAKEKLLPVVQETAKVDISKMSMLERTEHFEKLRKEKLEKKRIEKAEAEKTEIEKKKNQLFIKRQQSNSRWSHVRSRLGTQALKTDASTKKKDSKSKSLLDDCRSLVGGKPDTSTKENKSGAKKKSSKNQHETALKKKVVSKIRSRMSKRKESVKNKRPSLLDMCQGMLEGTQAATKHGLSADEVGTKKVIKPDLDAITVSDPAANAKDTVKTSSKQTPKQAETTVLKKPTPTIKIEEVEASQPTAPQNNVTVSPSPPKEVKFFDEAGSNKLKGKYIVQSPTKFAFDSFYRKRDKGTIKPGVSLLMARHEDTAKEEPIAVFFDRSKFTEEEASQWWDQNNFRFKISGKKPSEK